MSDWDGVERRVKDDPHVPQWEERRGRPPSVEALEAAAEAMEQGLADAAAETGRPKMATFSMAEFYRRHVLYAINELLLWPLGLALTIVVPDGEGSMVDRIGDDTTMMVSVWDYGDGHQETVVFGSDPTEDAKEYFAEFTRFVEERVNLMPQHERRLAWQRLSAAGYPWDHAPAEAEG